MAESKPKRGRTSRSREGKRMKTRRAILEAGQQLFSTRSIDGVSVDDITQAAIISKGSFYNYFDDKEQLASAILESIRGEIAVQVVQANRNVKDPAERMARALGLVLRFGRDNPERAQAILVLSKPNTDIKSPLNAGLVVDLKEGLASGRFRGIDVESGVLVVVGLSLIAIHHITRSHTRTPLQKLAKAMGAAILRGLGIEHTEAAKMSQYVADML